MTHSPTIPDNIKLLQKIDHNEHACKYYRLQTAKIPSGQYLLIQEWGRIGRTGKKLETTYKTHEEAQKQFTKLLQTKEKRGYAVMPESIDIPKQYADPPCDLCEKIQATEDGLVGLLNHSALYLHMNELNLPEMHLIYKHHIPDLFLLDSASLLGFFAELRRIQECLGQDLSDVTWSQNFEGPEHLWCKIQPRISSQNLFKNTIKDVHYYSNLIRNMNLISPCKSEEKELVHETNKQYFKQLSLLDMIDFFDKNQLNYLSKK